MRMKIQCNACESAEANVLCCADEEVLCWGCDAKIHTANKFATQHHRVPLSNSSSRMPKCDICQETIGFFFCLEDRALLCRKCDIAIHTANSYVSKHLRFLITGVKVGLEESEAVGSSAKKNLNSVDKVRSSQPLSKVPVTGQSNNEAVSTYKGELQSSQDPKVPVSDGSAFGGIPQWRLDELLGLTDSEEDFVLVKNGSTKADKAEIQESEWLKILAATEEGVHNREKSCNVADHVPWTVPQIFCPPVASSLNLPRYTESTISNCALLNNEQFGYMTDVSGHVADVYWTVPDIVSQSGVEPSLRKKHRKYSI